MMDDQTIPTDKLVSEQLTTNGSGGGTFLPNSTNLYKIIGGRTGGITSSSLVTDASNAGVSNTITNVINRGVNAEELVHDINHFKKINKKLQEIIDEQNIRISTLEDVVYQTLEDIRILIDMQNKSDEINSQTHETHDKKYHERMIKILKMNMK